MASQITTEHFAVFKKYKYLKYKKNNDNFMLASCIRFRNTDL